MLNLFKRYVRTNATLIPRLAHFFVQMIRTTDDDKNVNDDSRRLPEPASAIIGLAAGRSDEKLGADMGGMANGDIVGMARWNGE